MKRIVIDNGDRDKDGTPSSTAPIFHQSLISPTHSYSAPTTAEEQGNSYSSPSAVSYNSVLFTSLVSEQLSTMQHLGLGGNQPQTRTTGTSPPVVAVPDSQQQSPVNNFHRLKVEDALSYLDLVKHKFNNKPQVYNDFLDIMKEFKSQSIDTPGVIQRVSNLFKGFPELIVGFNTFLPPGYKIEVQRIDQSYAFQVSVSVPSPTGTMQSENQHKSMILKGSGLINMSSGAQIPLSQNSQLLSMGGQNPGPALQIPNSQSLLHHASAYSGGVPMYGPLSLSAAQAAVNQALQGHSEAPQNQPVEFNHAINYVNKIKNRFQGQPEKYKKFLEILHTYQKEQRTLKETTVGPLGAKHLTEQEVYSQVAKLFENQSDLLAEFGQFLPDATNHINQPPISDHPNVMKKQMLKQPFRDHLVEKHISHKPGLSGQLKKSPSIQGGLHREVPPSKKLKLSSGKDVTLAEAAKYGTLQDYAFFDKVRKAVRNQEAYNSFLRCLNLFNQEIVSKSELVQMVSPFLGKFPELMRWFREFMGQNETEAIPYNITRNERPQGELAMEIDLTTAKRLGASYCVIPISQEGLRCSGRTQLCKEVLNDQWVSFPTWSEDSTFVSSRKTQFEEYMYRCEDERFELDVVIETNSSTIRIFEGLQKKINRMGSEELGRYRLDECLGGTSTVLHQRALRRIYGDKAQDIIDGLKRTPGVVVPVVLRRLKAKEEEWREAQKGFNKIWREQNEKYYLKSLDHQGINFKQTDIKALRSKSLFNEIETISDERHEQNEESLEPIVGPHLILQYRDRTILDDAANLLIHNIKRQTGIQKSEKRQIKHLLLQFLPDFFFHPRQQLSDDEREDEDEKDESEENAVVTSSSAITFFKGSTSPGKSPGHSDNEALEIDDIKEEDIKTPLHAQTVQLDEAYTLFMANNNWYIFLRLHSVLCERLAKIYVRAVALAAEEAKMRINRKESTAIALRLKPKPQIEIEDYYPAFLDMVKNLLDGNMDSNTYEDTLREMFGIHAYVAFTLDKVVSYAVRQLQHCVTERSAIACTELFIKEQKRGGTGGPCNTAYKRAFAEMNYQRAVEKLLQDENCFKFYIYKKDCRMSIELLDTESGDKNNLDSMKKWSAYKDCFGKYERMGKFKLPVFLERNLRWYKKRIYRKSSKAEERRRESGDEENKNFESNTKCSDLESDKAYETRYEELERKLNERTQLTQNQSHASDYQIEDNTECKFNTLDCKIIFTVNKDFTFCKFSSFARAKKTHLEVTKKKGKRFRAWLKHWASMKVSDLQHKQCTDWLMGKGENVVPNKTRILSDNDLQKAPYVPYNRYKVDRFDNESA